MKWKDFVRDYFLFSRRDRIAVFTLLLILLILFFVPSLIAKKQEIDVHSNETWVQAIRELDQKDSFSANNTARRITYSKNETDTHNDAFAPFYFDPNTIAASDWNKLGLSNRTIQTIIHYLSKGGQFRKASDLKKIYGLSSFEYERIEPYIRIPQQSPNTDRLEAAVDYPKREKVYSLVDVNEADTSLFIALPGIGSKLAARIIHFRDRLGGFYSIDQVKETFGLPDSTFQKIKQYLQLGNRPVRQININEASLEELKAHPYIRWDLAGPIIAFRKEHGAFRSVEELKNIMAVSDEIFQRLKYYLRTD